MKQLFALFFMAPAICFAQYKGVSYQLRNETGTYYLTSLTVSHHIDNIEGTTYVTDKLEKDTLYQINQFLNGFVALSSDGRTVVHLKSEHHGLPLENAVLEIYRDGNKLPELQLTTLLKYSLDEAKNKQALPPSGWLRNDSLLHVMASNAFYCTDDKVFVSTSEPRLQVLDMNMINIIYTGNGANHFMQNYYAIPNLPFRSEFTTEEYFPKKIPATKNGQHFTDVLSATTGMQISIPEEAKYRVEINLFVDKSGKSEIRNARVYAVTSNQLEKEKTEQLKQNFPALEYNTATIPPRHPAWVFSQKFWMK